MNGLIHFDGNFIYLPWVAAAFIGLTLLVLGAFVGNALTIWQARAAHKRESTK